MIFATLPITVRCSSYTQTLVNIGFTHSSQGSRCPSPPFHRVRPDPRDDQKRVLHLKLRYRDTHSIYNGLFNRLPQPLVLPRRIQRREGATDNTNTAYHCTNSKVYSHSKGTDSPTALYVNIKVTAPSSLN